MTKIKFTPSILIFSLVVSGCAFKSKRSDNKNSEAAAQAVEQTPEQILGKPAENTSENNSGKSAEQTSGHVAVPTQLPEKSSDASHEPVVTTKTTAAPAHAKEGTDPVTSLRWLKNGNIRFIKNHLRKDGQSQKDVERLSTGQSPHTIVLSCSDSRVPPEIVFDQKLGEIFVVRTAGEVLDPGSIASIEYAVEHLGVKNLVVMGHTNCGAVKAAFSTLDGKDAGSENLNKLVGDIHPRIAKFKGRTASESFTQESWANVEGVMADLQKRSKILNEKSHDHKLQISGALYHLDSGYVDFK